MKTKTSPAIVKKMVDAGFTHSGCVSHHNPTDANLLGQSSLMGFVIDILDIIEKCEPGRESRELFRFLDQGEWSNEKEIDRGRSQAEWLLTKE